MRKGSNDKGVGAMQELNANSVLSMSAMRCNKRHGGAHRAVP
jgi:hypothetical protein